MAKLVLFGDKALDKKLASLGPKLANQIARSAMRHSAKGVMQSAKETLINSPSVVTGELRDSLNVKALTRSRYRIGVKVQTETDASGFGGFFLEFGTKHMAAEPFLRPAIYDNADAIRQQIIADVYAIIWDKSLVGRTLSAASKRGKKFKKKLTKLKKNTSRRLKKVKKNTSKRVKRGRKALSRRLKKSQKFIRSKAKKLTKQLKKTAKKRRAAKKKPGRRKRK